MNKSRELFLLFKPNMQIHDLFDMYNAKAGYVMIHKHSFPNDEPPYIMVSFWGRTSKYTIQKAEEAFEDTNEDNYSFYLIREKDADKYIHLRNESQRDYCGYYLEGIYTRNAGEHNLKPNQYADGAKIRYPKTKYIYDLPHQLK